MTLMLDPTQASDTVEAETQSLHAWSQEDTATDVVDYHQRGWKLPVTLAVFALVGMIGAATYLTWPEHHNTPTAAPPSAAKPQVAPTQPQVTPTDPVARYAALYRSRGGRIFPGQEKAAADEARNICQELATKPVGDEISGIVTSSPGFSRYSAGVVTNTAIDVFCPQYSLTK